MRRIELPLPKTSRRIEIRGPHGRSSTRSRAGSLRAFNRVLEKAAVRATEVRGGWTLWWGGSFGYQDNWIVGWIWPEDSDGGKRSADILMADFEGEGFLVRRCPKATIPPAVCRIPIVVHQDHARVGKVFFPKLRYVVNEDRADIYVECRFDHPPQTCPKCKRVVQPLRAVWGMPTRETEVSVAVGEVMAMGCIMGDGNAHCPECSWTFIAKGIHSRRTDVLNEDRT